MPESGDCLDEYDFDYVWLRADSGDPGSARGQVRQRTSPIFLVSFALSHNNNKQNPTKSKILLKD